MYCLVFMDNKIILIRKTGRKNSHNYSACFFIMEKSWEDTVKSSPFDAQKPMIQIFFLSTDTFVIFVIPVRVNTGGYKIIMAITIIEFKARVNDWEDMETRFLSLNPEYKGEDHQTDTYFHVNTGRLKLREGNIENALIYYRRPDATGLKQSDVLLYRHSPDPSLKEILTVLHGVKVVVDKRRKIYFMDNVKFHFDKVEHLGLFIEVEAIDVDGSIGLEKLEQQCCYYAEYFGIEKSQYVSGSYSDLLLEIKS